MDSCTLKFHIIPNSKQNLVAGMHGDAVKIKIQAPALDNKANQALIAFLSKTLSVKSRQIRILKGLSNREKIISFSEVSQEEIFGKLHVFKAS